MTFLKILISLFILFCFVCGLVALIGVFCTLQEWWDNSRIRESNRAVVLVDRVARVIGRGIKKVTVIVVSVLFSGLFLAAIVVIVYMIYLQIPF